MLLFLSSNKFDKYITDFDGLYLTPCNSYEYVFGFSRFGSITKIDAIFDILTKIIFNRFIRRKYYVTIPIEMQFLAAIANRRLD
jgi:hypothetical protein